MRTMTEDDKLVMSKEHSSRPTTSARIYSLRTYFDSLYTSNPPAWAYGADPDPMTEIWPQTADYHAATGDVISAINYNGMLVAMKSSSSTATTLLTGIPVDCRPGLTCNPQGDTAYIFAINSSEQIVRLNLTISTMSFTTTNLGFSYTSGAFNAINNNYAMMFTLNEGGVTPVIFGYTTSWTRKVSGKRFIVPNMLITDDKWLKYSAAIYAADETPDDAFFYLNNPTDGSVMGMRWRANYNDWTNVYTAVPADLSHFWITGAYRANVGGYRTILTGIFSRTEEFETGEQYILALESTDGINFSIERNSLVSSGSSMYAYAPIIKYVSDAYYLYGYDTNRIARDKLYRSDYITIASDRIKEFSDNSGIGQSSAALSLANHDEYYTNSPFIRRGNRVVVWQSYIGMAENIQYGTYLITGITEEFADGKRSLSLQLAHEGLEKTARFTHPFYTEILGHTGVNDTLEDTSNLYPAPKSGISKTWFQMDFWDSEASPKDGAVSGFYDALVGLNVIEKGGVTPTKINASHWGTAYGIQTADIKAALDLADYPEVIYGSTLATIADVVISMYGWSMTEATGQETDTVYPILIVENTEGEERWEYVTSTPTSTYGKFPQTYYDTAAGSYPVIRTHAGSNFSAGDKIKKIILVARAGNPTWICPERIRIDNVAVTYNDGHSNTMWDTNEEAPNTLELTKPGRTYMMFSQEPYSPFNFNAWARFSTTEHKEGNKWGVCGLATDAQNYIGGQYRIYDVSGTLYGVWEIVMHRGGKEFVLAASSPELGTLHLDQTILLTHRDGKLSVWTFDNGSQWWQRVWADIPDDYGPLTISEDEIMHVGVYGRLGIDGFMTTGYIHTTAEETSTDNDLIHDGIPVMPGWNEIDSFPSSGTIVIDDSEYTYSSLTYTGGPYALGPYQARQTAKYSEGMAIDMMWFDYNRSQTYFQNKLIASDNGHVWLINDDPYSIFNILVDGTVWKRSRHFGTHITGNYVGLDTRMYITRGLGGVALVENSGRHYHGSFVHLKPATKIVLKGFGASGGESYSSLAWLIDSACRTAGVTAQFCDYEPASVSFTSGANTYIRSTTDLSAQGYELRYTIPALTSGQWIGMYTNATFKLKDAYGVQKTGHIIAVENTGTNPYLYALDESLNPIEGLLIGSNESKQMHLIFYNNFCDVYDGDEWRHTFFFDEVTYPKVGTAVAVTGNFSGSITDVTLTELHKPRDAVYIEMNSSIQSAISNIVQERPVMVIPKSDGSLMFTYRSNLMPRHMPSKYSLYTSMIKSDNKSVTSKSSACSDAILYYKDVSAVVDQKYAEQEGFITRMLSLPNMEEDEIDSIAKLIMRANREAEVTHSISMRPDLRIEPGDIIDFTYTLSGTGTEFTSGDILVESVSISSSQNTMQITGRQLIT